MNMQMEILDKIRNIINPYVDNGSVSFGAIIATKDGKEIVRYSYGYQDIENNIPYKDTTIIRAFSTTKTFTALATFKCIEMGLFKIDDPISKYFSTFKNPTVSLNGKKIPAKRETIVKDLLDMRAGLSYPELGSDTGAYCIKIDAELAKDELTTIEFAEKLGSCPLLFSPGDDYHYSYCADVLGALIAKTSDMSLRDFFKKYIIDPLGLKDTDFFVNEENRHRIAKGYITRNGKLEPIEHHSLGITATGVKTKFESGGAGLFLTLDDLSRYAQCLLNKSEGIVSKETFKKLVEPEYSPNPTKQDNGNTYYNLMRHMERPDECQQCCTLGEFGWDGMLGTLIIIDPVNKITFTAACQSFDEIKWEMVNKVKSEVIKLYKHLQQKADKRLNQKI